MLMLWFLLNMEVTDSTSASTDLLRYMNYIIIIIIIIRVSAVVKDLSTSVNA